MMNPSQLPGAKWLPWLRSLSLRVGVLTGVYLTAVMVAAVLLANRVHFLEHFAHIRNAVCYLAFGLVMLVPIVAFRRQAVQLLVSGMLGWLLFTLAYLAMGVFFSNLHLRLRTPFNVFVLGAAFYGLMACVAWVVSMALEARSQSAIASRRRSL